MNEHIVKSFTEQLDALANCIAQMGGLVEAQFGNAIEAIAKRDTQQAETAISTDKRVDELQQSVEEQALKVLALRQPMAVDLRTTLAAIRIASELERIGDYAKNIGKRALVLNREPPIRLTQSLARMGRQAMAQLKTVLDAYSDRDAKAAKEVWYQDKEIDELYNSLFRELLIYMMEESAQDRNVHAFVVRSEKYRTGRRPRYQYRRDRLSHVDRRIFALRRATQGRCNSERAFTKLSQCS